MLKVEEVRSIKVSINYTPNKWDPTNLSGTDTNRWHKAKLLNQRVEKYAPQLSPMEFYVNIDCFAQNLGFGDPNVIAAITEYIYKTKLVFEEEQAV